MLRDVWLDCLGYLYTDTQTRSTYTEYRIKHEASGFTAINRKYNIQSMAERTKNV